MELTLLQREMCLCLLESDVSFIYDPAIFFYLVVVFGFLSLKRTKKNLKG